MFKNHLDSVGSCPKTSLKQLHKNCEYKHKMNSILKPFGIK